MAPTHSSNNIIEIYFSHIFVSLPPSVVTRKRNKYIEISIETVTVHINYNWLHENDKHKPSESDWVNIQFGERITFLEHFSQVQFCWNKDRIKDRIAASANFGQNSGMFLIELGFLLNIKNSPKHLGAASDRFILYGFYSIPFVWN